jgi:hypothetical protein
MSIAVVEVEISMVETLVALLQEVSERKRYVQDML